VRVAVAQRQHLRFGRVYRHRRGNRRAARRALDDEQIRFAHPLLASLCYDRAPIWRRRDVHRRLAMAVTDIEERARHLALSTDGPEVALSAELDAAAAHAAGRGAMSAAAELAEVASLTPTSEPKAGHRRRLTAATFHWLTGDVERAATIYHELLAVLPPGAARSHALRRVDADEPGRLAADDDRVAVDDPLAAGT